MSYDVSFQYYTDVYKGIRINNADAFARLSRLATAYLDTVTRGKAMSHPARESVWNAICAIADEYQLSDEGGEIVSQTVGGWSKTYAQGNHSVMGRFFDAAKLFLPGLVSAGYWV